MITNLEEFMTYVAAQVELGREWVKNFMLVGNINVVYFKRNETIAALSA